jgi:hypothetical protein
MTYIVYAPDRTIKTFLERIDDLQLAEGETFAVSPLSLANYAHRFVISHAGQPCRTVYVHKGDADVVIDISAPGETSVSVAVNDEVREISLQGGHGQIVLPTSSAGVLCLGPGDPTRYCAAGEGSLLVILLE